MGHQKEDKEMVKWRPWPGPDDCPVCEDGGDLEMLTDCAPDEVCEDDEVRCIGCGAIGVVHCDSEGDDPPWILWDEED